MFNLLFWLFVLILALSYFGISLEAIVASPAGRANFGYVLYLLSQLWQLLITHIRAL
jgi:cellulose synthase/poly-beta-1,6-N-acetylglucosamine synthase-like glycosyltransferase